MTKYVIDDTTLSSIAGAIRGKTGKTEKIYVAEFANEIAKIEGGGGIVPSGNLIITENNRLYDVREYETATVNIPVPDNPTTGGGTVAIDSLKSRLTEYGTPSSVDGLKATNGGSFLEINCETGEVVERQGVSFGTYSSITAKYMLVAIGDTLSFEGYMSGEKFEASIILLYPENGGGYKLYYNPLQASGADKWAIGADLSGKTLNLVEEFTDNTGSVRRIWEDLYRIANDKGQGGNNVTVTVSTSHAEGYSFVFHYDYTHADGSYIQLEGNGGYIVKWNTSNSIEENNTPYQIPDGVTITGITATCGGASFSAETELLEWLNNFLPLG